MCGGKDNHGNSLLCVVISVHTYNERVLWRILHVHVVLLLYSVTPRTCKYDSKEEVGM